MNIFNGDNMEHSNEDESYKVLMFSVEVDAMSVLSDSMMTEVKVNCQSFMTDKQYEDFQEGLELCCDAVVGAMREMVMTRMISDLEEGSGLEQTSEEDEDESYE